MYVNFEKGTLFQISERGVYTKWHNVTAPFSEGEKKPHHKSSRNLFAINLSHGLGSTVSFSDSPHLCPLLHLRNLCFPAQKCLFSLYILLLSSSKMQAEREMKEHFSAGLPANLKFSTQVQQSIGKTRLSPKTLHNFANSTSLQTISSASAEYYSPC